jgi:hypothetical protein
VSETERFRDARWEGATGAGESERVGEWV